MILLYAVIVGLAASLLRARLTHRTLQIPQLRWEWLMLIAVIPQILVFYLPAISQYIPNFIIPTVQILSMLGLIVFVLMNAMSPGFWALGLGLIANFLVIISNGGWMPISIEILQRLPAANTQQPWTVGARLGYSKDIIMSPADIRLIWLSDQFTLPSGLPQNIIFSPGDIFIAIGVFFLMWSLSQNTDEKEKK